jgi:ribonuclease E
VPSPAEFNFGHHDLPDTSPDALADGDAEFGPEDDLPNDAQAPGANAANAQDRDGERRRRRGRRGRRGRGRDREREPHRAADNAPEGDAAQGEPWREPRRERPIVESGILSETANAPSFAHPAMVRPQPQFTLDAPVTEERRFEEPVSAAMPAPAPKPEPKSEWRLSSLFGFGPREPAKEPPRPVVTSAPPAPEIAPIPERAAVQDSTPAETESAGPKRGGWWQKRG